MAKISGLAAVVTVDTAAGSPTVISNDVTNFQFATPKGVQDVTGVDKAAHERLLLLADYSATIAGVFNDVGAHLVFKTVPSNPAVARNVKIQPSGASAVFLSCLCLLADYAITRAAAGELTYSVPAVLSDGTVPSWS
jgi:hypothetical protein